MMSAVIRGARGMVATTSFNAGDVVQRLLPLPDHFDDHYENTRVADPRIRWVNVSASPSTEIIDRVLYARTCIELGDEITVATPLTGFYNIYDENNDGNNEGNNEDKEEIDRLARVSFEHALGSS